MNRFLKGILMMTVFVGLAITNPYQKNKFAQSLTHRAHDILFSEESHEPCTAIQVITCPAIESLIYLNTSSKNSVIFTFFHTGIPCLDIYSIGIAGQYFSFPVYKEDIYLCGFLVPLPHTDNLATKKIE